MHWFEFSQESIVLQAICFWLVSYNVIEILHMADKLSPDVFKCSLPNSVIFFPQSYWSINLPVSVCFTNTIQVFSFVLYPTPLLHCLIFLTS